MFRDKAMVCPVVHNEEKLYANPSFFSKQPMQRGLVVGLIAGIMSFALLPKNRKYTSASITLGVVSGFFAAYLKYQKLKQKPKCPVVSRGFFADTSLTRRYGTHPSFIIASSGAALLQMLYPRVVRMIAISRKFYNDPKGRVENTGSHAKTIKFGTKEMVIAGAQEFKRRHDSLVTTDPETGIEYHASEPELVEWVHNTLVWMTLRTFREFGPHFTAAEEDQYIQEQLIEAEFATLQKEKLPQNMAQLDEYVKNVSFIKLILNNDSEEFRDFIFKKSFPRSLFSSIENIFAYAGLLVMLPEQRALYGLPIDEEAVRSRAGFLIRLLNWLYPAEKTIAKVHEELARHSFGDYLLKKSR